MSVSERDYLKARRDRALGTIMRHLEGNVFAVLSREQQLACRQTVLDALNNYHDSVLDLVKSDDGLRNTMIPEVLDRIERLGRDVRKLVPSPVDDVPPADVPTSDGPVTAPDPEFGSAVQAPV